MILENAMTTVHTTKLSLFKNYLFRNKPSTVYDILRPVYYCSLLTGMAQFNVKGEKFTSCIWILLWNGIIVIFCETFGLLTLTTRVFRGRVGAMYTIADLAQGWVCTINVAIVVIFGGIFKNTVSVFICLKSACNQLFLGAKNFGRFTHFRSRAHSFKLH